MILLDNGNEISIEEAFETIRLFSRKIFKTKQEITDFFESKGWSNNDMVYIARLVKNAINLEIECQEVK